MKLKDIEHAAELSRRLSAVTRAIEAARRGGDDLHYSIEVKSGTGLRSESVHSISLTSTELVQFLETIRHDTFESLLKLGVDP